MPAVMQEYNPDSVWTASEDKLHFSPYFLGSVLNESHIQYHQSGTNSQENLLFLT
jgi:hypothetical protein